MYNLVKVNINYNYRFWNVGYMSSSIDNCVIIYDWGEINAFWVFQFTDDLDFRIIFLLQLDKGHNYFTQKKVNYLFEFR